MTWKPGVWLMSDLPEPGFSTELSTNAVDMPETWRLLLVVAGIAILNIAAARSFLDSSPGSLAAFPLLCVRPRQPFPRARRTAEQPRGGAL
jgi:hypothetical protein